MRVEEAWWQQGSLGELLWVAVSRLVWPRTTHIATQQTQDNEQIGLTL